MLQGVIQTTLNWNFSGTPSVPELETLIILIGCARGWDRWKL